MDNISLRSIHAALVEKRTELMKILEDRSEIQIEGRQADALDEALASSARTMAVERVGRDMKLLRRVEAAIDRITHGDFGYCADCEDSIPSTRLSVVPWAERCIGCQEEHDVQNKEASQVPQFTRRLR